MYQVKWGTPPRLLLLLLFSLGVFVVCNSNKEQSAEGVATATASDQRSDSAIIESTFKEVMTRWSYRDMAALYDMEFEYVQDKFTYDDYLKQPEIKGTAIDSFYDFKVKSVKKFGDDSALVDNIIILKGPSGKISEYPQQVMMYHYKGRWIKPFIGVAAFQRQYEEMIRKADSAAAAEEAEDMGD